MTPLNSIESFFLNIAEKVFTSKNDQYSSLQGANNLSEQMKQGIQNAKLVAKNNEIIHLRDKLIAGLQTEVHSITYAKYPELYQFN